MTDRARVGSSHQNRLYVAFIAELARVCSTWLVLYPVYRPLAHCPSLETSRGDRLLFAPGLEGLIGLLFEDAAWLDRLTPALLMLAVVSALLGILTSSFVWNALATPHLWRSRSFWLRVKRSLPTLTLIAPSTWVVVGALGYTWWELFPIVGALLEPGLGEMATDLIQLGLLGGVLGLAGVVLMVADVARAAVATAGSPFVEAVVRALIACRTQPSAMALQAMVRGLLAIGIQLANAYAMMRLEWLARSTWLAWLAVLTTEVALFASLWLRLGWIEWLLVRLSTRRQRQRT